MKNVLLTAFEPYDRWKTNASWLTLVQLTHDRPTSPKITTRLYPVDFAAVQARLREDLQANYDYVLHLGQAPGSTRIRLESIGLNIGGPVSGSVSDSPDQFRPLVEDGPVAYRTELPLGQWAVKLRRAGIPAQVSYHAGTFLCNATLYLTHHLIEQLGLKSKAAFVHVPLDATQVLHESQELAALPSAVTASAIRLLLEELR